MTRKLSAHVHWTKVFHFIVVCMYEITNSHLIQNVLLLMRGGTCRERKDKKGKWKTETMWEREKTLLFNNLIEVDVFQF